MNDRKYSVLIVDDERSHISALKDMLSEYTIYAATDGQDAIETVETNLPDIILLDILMPDMDGYDVISALKESEKTKDIPVIIISGLDDKEAEEKALSLGAADYIFKPFHPPIVRLRIRNALKHLQ